MAGFIDCDHNAVTRQGSAPWGAWTGKSDAHPLEGPHPAPASKRIRHSMGLRPGEHDVRSPGAGGCAVRNSPQGPARGSGPAHRGSSCWMPPERFEPCGMLPGRPSYSPGQRNGGKRWSSSLRAKMVSSGRRFGLWNSARTRVPAHRGALRIRITGPRTVRWQSRSEHRPARTAPTAPAPRTAP